MIIFSTQLKNIYKIYLRKVQINILTKNNIIIFFVKYIFFENIPNYNYFSVLKLCVKSVLKVVL